MGFSSYHIYILISPILKVMVIQILTANSDLRHSIANINLHKSNTKHFCASSYHL